MWVCIIKETTEAAQALLCTQLRFSAVWLAPPTARYCLLSSSKPEGKLQHVPGNGQTQATNCMRSALAVCLGGRGAPAGQFLGFTGYILRKTSTPQNKPKTSSD